MIIILARVMALLTGRAAALGLAFFAIPKFPVFLIGGGLSKCLLLLG